MRRLYVTLIMLATVLTLSARQESADAAQLYFGVASTDVDEQLPANAEGLAALDVMARQFAAVDETKRYIIVHSYTSPEGSPVVNRRLADQRAMSVARTFFNKVGHDAHTIFRSDVYDWSYLRQLVSDDPAVPSRADVLALLPTDGSAKLSDAESRTLLQRLKDLDGGKPYAYMFKQLFPLMRRVVLETRYIGQSPAATTPAKPAQEEQQAQEEQPVQTIVQDAIKVDTIALHQESFENKGFEQADTLLQRIRRGPRNAYFGLKTNLLYDLALTPNIGVEWSPVRHFSLQANWMYAWWSNDSKHRYWRIYGGDAEARYWFDGSRRLTGHHLGAYAGMYTYDIEFGGRGYQGQKWTTTYGLSYGYSAPIGRRLNLDFTLGVGYLTGEYFEYEPYGRNYYWEQTRQRRWFGPTKAEVSLVWRLGRGNTNTPKNSTDNIQQRPDITQ